MRDLLYTVFTRIAPAFEEEFNDWQEREHIPYLLELPGYQSVIRYRDCDCAHRYANFWHITSMADFQNPQRLVKANTPWGMRLSPYRDRHIDFYIQDKGPNACPPMAETDDRFSVLLMESYRDADDQRKNITEFYRQRLCNIRRMPHVLDVRIYHAYQKKGIEENCVFYYLSGSLTQVMADTIPPLDTLLSPIQEYSLRTRYIRISHHSN